MKKIAFILGMSFLCSASRLLGQQPAMAPAQPTNVPNKLNWQPNYNGAVSLARSTSKPILILFTGTTWCPACMKLERDVLTKTEFAKAVGDKFIFLKAEFPNYTAESIQSSPFKFLLDRYQVDSFPTIIAINPEGQVLFTVNYQASGADVYANELINKLNQSRNPAAFNQGYYN